MWNFLGSLKVKSYRIVDSLNWDCTPLLPTILRLGASEIFQLHMQTLCSLALKQGNMGKHMKVRAKCNMGVKA